MNVCSLLSQALRLFLGSLVLLHYRLAYTSSTVPAYAVGWGLEPGLSTWLPSNIIPAKTKSIIKKAGLSKSEDSLEGCVSAKVETHAYRKGHNTNQRYNLEIHVFNLSA
jgi:hypothetical protein